MTTKVPTLPPVSGGDTEYFLTNVKMLLDVREGRSGDKLDANVTYRDLVGLGLAKDPTGSVVYTGQTATTGLPVLPFGVDNDGYDPTTDLTPPPAPTNVAAAGSIGAVFISWDVPTYRNHSYAEIWRSGVDDIGTAALIGTASSQGFVDIPGDSLVRYYWIRFVSKANVRGPYSQESVTATAAADPAVLIAAIQGQVSESALSQSLSTRINRLSENTDVIGSVQNALAVEKVARETTEGELFAQYTVKIDQNGFVSGFGLASQTTNGVPVSDFQVRADRFAIVNPSVSLITVSSLTRSGATATLNTSTAHGLAVNDEFVIRGVTNDTNWNGSYTVATVPSSTQITFSVTGTYAAAAATPASGTMRVGKTVVPFVVDGGVVYIDTAVVKDASITSAKIASLVANKITAGYINATVGVNGAQIYGGEFYAGGSTTVQADGSGNVTGFTASNPTVKIQSGNFTAVANSFVISNSATGTPTNFTPFKVVNNIVYIDEARIQNGTITFAKIEDTLSSTNYSAGSNGWSISKNGNAEFNTATFRGTVDLKSSTSGARMEMKNNVIKIFDANDVLRVKLGDLSA